MSWRKLLRYLFFLRRPEEEEMSSDDLLTMDTHVEDESIVDEEGLMVEHGEVVGETAIITAEKQLQPTGGPLPERLQQQHTFNSDRELLLRASYRVAYLVVEFRGSTTNGTALFIDEKHLLTAGHCFYDRNKKTDTIKRIRVVSPGLPYINYSDLENGEIFTLDCTIVKNLFKGTPDPNEPDIALLHAGTGNGPLGTELSADLPPPGAVVDVIGYPQEPVMAWLKKKLNNIKDIDETIKTVRKLLPYRTLTISRGIIKTIGKSYITYQVSTVPGMSGSCLVYQGKVIGVHIGDVKDSQGEFIPYAVSFNSDQIQSLFRKEKLSHLIHQPNGVIEP